MDDEKKKVDPARRVATVVLVLAAAGVLIGTVGAARFNALFH